MPKYRYRIVKRNTDPSGHPSNNDDWYYAQCKIFGIWIDLRHCRFIPLTTTVNSYHQFYPHVEECLEKHISNQKKKFVQEVIKCYE
jgi:hypothetical protein